MDKKQIKKYILKNVNNDIFQKNKENEDKIKDFFKNNNNNLNRSDSALSVNMKKNKDNNRNDFILNKSLYKDCNENKKHIIKENITIKPLNYRTPKNDETIKLTENQNKRINKDKEKEANLLQNIKNSQNIYIKTKLNNIQQFTKNIIEKENEDFRKSKEQNTKILDNQKDFIINENKQKEKLYFLKEKDKFIQLKEKEINELKEKLKIMESQIKYYEEIKIKLEDYEKNKEIMKDNEYKFRKRVEAFREKEKELDKKITENKNKENELNKRITEYKNKVLNKNDNDKEKELNLKISVIDEKESNLEKKYTAFYEKEKALHQRTSNIYKKEEELTIKISEIEKKEKELNNKMRLLEIKENQLEKERNEFNLLRNIYQKENENKIKNGQEYNNLLIKYNHLEKELNDLKQKLNKKPLELYKNPVLIGLNNIGATCFMNSTLQCLSQTKALTNYFLNEKNKEKILNISIKNNKEKQLSPFYLELIQKLWDKNNSTAYSPYNLMKIINDLNPLFKTGEAGDSKDFIIFILEQLHKELKRSIDFKRNNSNRNANEPLNQYDPTNAFNHFFTDFTKECSIISDIFIGINQTTNICLNCKNIYNSKNLDYPICYNYEIFNCLVFPLEEVKKMKYSSKQIYNYIDNQINNNNVSLYDCFVYNQKEEKFTGENENYCNKCKQLYDSIYSTKIYVSPNVLVLILNRGKGNIYDVKLNFTEKIDITDYVIMKDNNNQRLIYELYGVITHIGKSGPNAHFIASCKSPIDNNWYRFNDAIVSPVTNIQKEVIDFGTPYILFYQKNCCKQ